MTTPKQRAFFASLQGSKFLCKDCESMQLFKKYIKSGIIELSCGHERHTHFVDTDKMKEQEVLNKLDDKFITYKCLKSQHWECPSYRCSCPCHKRKI